MSTLITTTHLYKKRNHFVVIVIYVTVSNFVFSVVLCLKLLINLKTSMCLELPKCVARSFGNRLCRLNIHGIYCSDINCQLSSTILLLQLPPVACVPFWQDVSCIKYLYLLQCYLRKGKVPRKNSLCVLFWVRAILSWCP